MSVEVANLSEEDFDKEFDKMMTMTPEDFDASNSQPEEETLTESPASNESELQTEDPIEVNNEQPNEIVEEELDKEAPAGEELDAGEPEAKVDEDSKEDEYNFDTVPRDKIIPRDIAVNGMNVRATMNELEDGFKKGMNYTQKMQEIAPHRKNMNLMSEHGLSTDDLNLLVEAKQGNKEAIGKLLANAKVDPLDVDAEESQNYEPQNYGKEPSHLEMEQIKTEILADTDNAPIVESALQTMPEDMYTMVSSETSGMNSLYSDIKSGLYQKVMPEVIKQQSLYGIQEPTLQTYLRVAQSLNVAEPVAKTPESAPQANNEELNNKRRSAAAANTSVPSKKESFIAKDLDEMDDDVFEAEFQKMIGRSTNDFK